MGFYLRKSFRAGPIRFNLSKSGIGASVGVTGARVGLSSSGRGYVHGGSGGLYYRKSLGGRGGGNGSASAGGGSRIWTAPVELTEETGVTYGAPGGPEEATPDATAAPVRESPRTFGWLALGLVAVSLLFPAPLLLKKRLLRSFSRDGQRSKVRGLVVDKEGTLLVTSKRVVLIHLGVTSFPIRRILDLEVDHDRQPLVLTRNGVATPTYLTTPDALRAGAIVAALTDRR